MLAWERHYLYFRHLFLFSHFFFLDPVLFCRVLSSTPSFSLILSAVFQIFSLLERRPKNPKRCHVPSSVLLRLHSWLHVVPKPLCLLIAQLPSFLPAFTNSHLDGSFSFWGETLADVIWVLQWCQLWCSLCWSLVFTPLLSHKFWLIAILFSTYRYWWWVFIFTLPVAVWGF